jgi:tetratricopeptide (TPR) repeat protein
MDAVLGALGATDTDYAIELAEAALAAGDEHPLLLNLSAFGHERAGRLDEALRRLSRALELAPKDVTILTSIGATLTQLGRDQEALPYFDAALSLHPGHAPAHHGRGLAVTALGEKDEGRRSYLRAADLDPRFPDPLAALAEIALGKGEADKARLLAERALSLDRTQAQAGMVLATLEAKAGGHAIAAARLTELLSTPLSRLHRAAAELLLADQLDRLERPLEAFEASLRGNHLLRQVYAPIYEREAVETGTQLAERLLGFMQASTPADWAPAGKDAPDCKGHVFLVGFVRSGTTLLEQVLASHPDVAALEEQPTLRAITPAYFGDNGGMERLKTLSVEEADGLRADYWSKVRGFLDPTGKMFVDKAPLSTLWLPMIAKLFPDAKVLFAVRDPRDVVISAFRHRFQINALAWGFTDLEGTARFYAATMALAQQYRQMLPLSLYEHRHESLVRDFDGEVGRICQFLGIDQTASMADFAETAKRRDVRTPSAEQVRQGLFSEGMGRWRRYGAATAPMLPILAPWVAHFGYPADEVITP